MVYNTLTTQEPQIHVGNLLITGTSKLRSALKAIDELELSEIQKHEQQGTFRIDGETISIRAIS